MHDVCPLCSRTKPLKGYSLRHYADVCLTCSNLEALTISRLKGKQRLTALVSIVSEYIND